MRPYTMSGSKYFTQAAGIFWRVSAGQTSWFIHHGWLSLRQMHHVSRHLHQTTITPLHWSEIFAIELISYTCLVPAPSPERSFLSTSLQARDSRLDLLTSPLSHPLFYAVRFPPVLSDVLEVTYFRGGAECCGHVTEHLCPIFNLCFYQNGLWKWWPNWHVLNWADLHINYKISEKRFFFPLSWKRAITEP